MAFGEDDAESAGTDRDQAESLVELRIGGLESLDRSHVELVGGVEQPDEAEVGGGELEAMAERAVEHWRQLMKLGDLDRDRVQRFQLLAECGSFVVCHRLLFYGTENVGCPRPIRATEIDSTDTLPALREGNQLL